MAKLIAPVVGYRLRLSSGKLGKVHLEKSGGTPRNALTVCKFILWDDTPKVDLETVRPEEICQQCIGAMKVKP